MKKINVSGGNVPIFLRELRRLQQQGGQLKTELFYIDADGPSGVEMTERLVPISQACTTIAKTAGKRVPNEYYLPKEGDTFKLLVYFARAQAYVHYDPHTGSFSSSKHYMYCVRQTTCRITTLGMSWESVKKQVLAREPGYFARGK